MNLGKTAFEAMRKEQRRRNPWAPIARYEFVDLTDEDQHTWSHVAAMVMGEILSQKSSCVLSVREKQEVEFAATYKVDFDHGTSGHLAYTVIDKLAQALHNNLVPIIIEGPKDG